MDSEDKRNVWFVGIIAGFILLFTGSIILHYNVEHRAMIKAGWTRTTMIGTKYVQWTMEDPK